MAKQIEKSTVKCNNCEWQGTEQGLQWVSGEINNPETDYKACPNCLTDSYLMDIEDVKMFRLMNHDSSHNKPEFEAYTVEEHNKQFETNYTSIEEAVSEDPEYLFTEKDKNEYLKK